VEIVKDENLENPVTFREMQWDTEFFGVTCAKAIIYRKLKIKEWKELKKRFGDYQFISIENRNSEPTNAQFIGGGTNAFLADVNIQFKKKVESYSNMPDTVQIYQSMELSEQITEIGDFQFSKFTEDPELAKRGGSEVYKQWLINSFGKPDKFYAISKSINGEINGFLLHSYSGRICTIELIAVSRNATRNGIGTNLFKAVEYAAYQNGCDEIRVGTQVRNMPAINFNHKYGCEQVGCHQIYHLWNL
jgi:dTDP-4-amino-4,6-dideoxy-D-galactose acyltransferase